MAAEFNRCPPAVKWFAAGKQFETVLVSGVIIALGGLFTLNTQHSVHAAPPEAAASEPPATTPPQSVKSAAPTTNNTRFPVPSEAERIKAEGVIREVYADQLQSAKTAVDRLALSRKLEEQGLDANNPADVRYAAFRLARSLAIEAGDVAQAIGLVTLTGEHFAIHPVMEKTALLTAMSEKGSVAVRSQALAAARRELDELMQGDSYAEAIEMGRAAFAIARLVRDKDALDRIAECAKLLRRRQNASVEYQAALTRLKDDPTDAQANLIVGRWSWFVKNDVALGLKYLAAGDDKKLAAMAATDLAGPASGKEQRELADQWRALGGKEEEPATRKALLLRAQFWYQQALLGSAGLEKARLEKYLAELNQQLAPEPANLAVDSPANAAKSTSKTAKSSDSAKSAWKPPTRNANTAFRSFLGIYLYHSDKTKLYPVVNLRLPNRNLWTQEVQDKVRGRISFDEISYFGSASIAIPADGVYVLNVPDGKLSINDTPTDGSGDLNIVKGLHRVTFEVGTHGQPYIVGAAISLRHKQSGEEVVFFNSWKDIQSFLSTPINGQRVLDVSDWKPSEVDEVKVTPKTLKITVGGK